MGINLHPTEAYSKTHFYAASGYKPDKIEDPNTGRMVPIDDIETDVINYYIDEGRTVLKFGLDLPKEVEKNLKDLIKESNDWDHGGGGFCTERVKNMIKSAYEMSGFSKENAATEVDKFMPFSTPSGIIPSSVWGISKKETEDKFKAMGYKFVVAYRRGKDDQKQGSYTEFQAISVDVDGLRNKSKSNTEFWNSILSLLN